MYPLSQLLNSDKVHLLALKADFETTLLIGGISKSFVITEIMSYLHSWHLKKSSKSNFITLAGSTCVGIWWLEYLCTSTGCHLELELNCVRCLYVGDILEECASNLSSLMSVNKFIFFSYSWRFVRGMWRVHFAHNSYAYNSYMKINLFSNKSIRI